MSEVNMWEIEDSFRAQGYHRSGGPQQDQTNGDRTGQICGPGRWTVQICCQGNQQNDSNQTGTDTHRFRQSGLDFGQDLSKDLQ